MMQPAGAGRPGRRRFFHRFELEDLSLDADPFAGP
jgi:hypothetical protein